MELKELSEQINKIASGIPNYSSSNLSINVIQTNSGIFILKYQISLYVNNKSINTRNHNDYEPLLEELELIVKQEVTINQTQKLVL
jgi:hypothetical protein